MRSVYARVLTAGLLVLLASPAFAQPPGGRGMFQPNAAMLLRDPKVQDELKLTDDQKADFKKIADKYKDDLEKARTDRDFPKLIELFKSASEDVDKAVPTVLKPEQRKRLNQLLVQVSGLTAFSKDDVKTALKFSDKQEKEIQTTLDELKKDREDLLKDVGEDREKRVEARKKIQAMQKDAMDKIVEGFSADQKKEWKELTGAKFEFTPFGGNRPRPGGEKPKDNSK